MCKIIVVNKRKHKQTPHDFYCGRPNILGNRFSHLPKGTLAEFKVSTREEAIEKYKEDFKEQMKYNMEFRKEFFRIYEHLTKHYLVYLICWCAPQSCHCDVIKENLESQHLINME